MFRLCRFFHSESSSNRSRSGPSIVETIATALEGGLSTSGPIDIEALPAKQAGINRPCPRPEHRQTGGQPCQEDVRPGVLRQRRIEH